MKKINLAIALCAMTATTIFTTSCKDDKKPTPTPASKTPQELIIGTWKSTYGGSDANNNGIWDATEKGNPEDLVYITFKTGGSYLLMSDDTVSGQYVFISDNKQLITTDSGSTPDTVSVDVLNESTLQVHSVEGSNKIYFSEFAKQS